MKLLFFILLSLLAYTTARSFTIALHQNRNGVRTLEYMMLKHISNPLSKNYGHYLSINQINDLVQTPIEHRKIVMEWLHNNNFKDCIDLYDAIKCTSNLKQTAKLQRMPTNIRQHILFIDGLHDFTIPKPRRIKRIKSNIDVDPGIVSREVLMRVYNLNNTQVGPQVSIGAMEFMGIDGFGDRDLLHSESENGVRNNSIAKDHIIGINNSPDGESQLDVQVMYWAANDATLWYEDYKGRNDNGWIYSWANDFLNRQNVPQVVSLSWGWSETAQCTFAKCNNDTSRQYVERTNVELMKIGARGVTIVVASGDAGSPDRVNENCNSNTSPTGWTNMNPIFPGGSQWVVSVGGTYLLKSNNENNYQTPICKGNQCAYGNVEQMTTFNQTGWTSGANFVHWFPAPSWQVPLINKYLNSGVALPKSMYFNSSNRAYPDVSSFGHNCAVYYGNQLSPEDGTSCAAPIFAGILTHLNAYQLSKGRPLLGFATQLLYKLYEKNPRSFNDILVGDSSCTEEQCCGRNFGYLATKGWDVVSGLGTPNVAEMKKTLDSLF